MSNLHTQGFSFYNFLRVGKAISNNIDNPNFRFFKKVDISAKSQSSDQTDPSAKFVWINVYLELPHMLILKNHGWYRIFLKTGDKFKSKNNIKRRF